jgi:hypothetical protein
MIPESPLSVHDSMHLIATFLHPVRISGGISWGLIWYDEVVMYDFWFKRT